MKEELLLANSKIPVLHLEGTRQKNPYDFINAGEEAEVRKYDERYAVKLFFRFDTLKMRVMKLRRVEIFSHFSDPNFTFPIGFVGYDKEKDGFYMNRVITHPQHPDFSALVNLIDLYVKREIVLKASETMKRAHAQGILLGDVKADNILIDKDNNPVFVDTDSYTKFDMDFDLDLLRREWHETTFGKDCSTIDSDKYLLALEVLRANAGGIITWPVMFIREFYWGLIQKLNVSPEVKDGLMLIFSDHEDKPYIGDVWEKIDPQEPILLDEDYWGIRKKYKL